MAGDIFDSSAPRPWMIAVLIKLLQYAEAKKVDVWMIPGNHDCGVHYHSLEYLNTLLENVHLVIEPKKVKIDGLTVGFLPHIPREIMEIEIANHGSYMDYALSKIKTTVDVVIGHAHINGAKNASDIEIEAGEALEFDPGQFFKFKWGVFGHIHKPQVLKRNKIFYTGSIVTNSFDEAEIEKGYVHVLDRTTCEFIPFTTPETPYKHIVIDLVSKSTLDTTKIKALAEGNIIKLSVYAQTLTQIDETALRKEFNKYGTVVRFEAIIVSEAGEVLNTDITDVFTAVNYVPVLTSWIKSKKYPAAQAKAAIACGTEIITEVLNAERN